MFGASRHEFHPRLPAKFAATPAVRCDGLSIGIVMARFNKAVGEGLLSACCHELRRLGVTDIQLVTVPGALEIP